MTAQPETGGLSALLPDTKKKQQFHVFDKVLFQCGVNVRHMISAKELKRLYGGGPREQPFYGGACDHSGIQP